MEQNHDNTSHNTPTQKKRPPLYLYYWVVVLFLLILALMYLKYNVFSAIDVIQEMNNIQNPPQVKIIP